MRPTDREINARIDLWMEDVMRGDVGLLDALGWTHSELEAWFIRDLPAPDRPLPDIETLMRPPPPGWGALENVR